MSPVPAACPVNDTSWIMVYYEYTSEALRSLKENHHLFHRLKKELDEEVSLALVNAFERECMFDYERRRAAGTEGVWLKLRNANLGKIIDTWKEEGNHDVWEDISEVIQLRDWLAHGKRWAIGSTLPPLPNIFWERLKKGLTVIMFRPPASS